MNKFANRRSQGPAGKTGDTGPIGPPGIDVLCQFFWPQLQEWITKNQTVAYYFDTRTSGFVIEKDKIVAIRNQTGTTWNGYLSYGDKFGELISEYGHLSLQFNQEIYKIGKELFPFGRSMHKLMIILNFKRKSSVPGKEIILSDKMGYRQIYLHDNYVYFVCDDQTMKFRYVQGKWNAVFIECNDNRSMDSFFAVNCSKRQTFSIRAAAPDNYLYIGGLKSDNFFKGAIGRLEILHQPINEREIFPKLLMDKYIFNKFVYQHPPHP